MNDYGRSTDYAKSVGSGLQEQINDRSWLSKVSFKNSIFRVCFAFKYLRR